MPIVIGEKRESDFTDPIGMLGDCHRRIVRFLHVLTALAAKQKDISVDSATWNRRYREYMEKIKTGSVFEIAEVLRDLYLLKFDKDLSFGERKMLDTARNLLIKELSLAKGVNEDDIEGDLKTIFNC